MRAKDCLDRVSALGEDTLKVDLAKRWFQCDIWDVGTGLRGSVISTGSQPNYRIALTKCVMAGTSTTLTNYFEQWCKAFDSMLRDPTPKASTKTSTKFNVVSRFWSMPKGEAPLALVLVPREAWLSKERLKDFAEKVDPPGKEGQQYEFTFEDAEQQVHHTHALFSTHPLGFYSTWIPLNALNRLVALQTKNSSWIRSVPTTKQIAALNTSLQAKVYQGKNKYLQNIAKFDAPFGFVWNAYDLLAGEPIDVNARISTETFMGLSANKVRLQWILISKPHLFF